MKPFSRKQATGVEKKSGFVYHRPSADDVKKRATSRGGNRDSFVIDAIQMFTPGDKLNKVRYLPQTWSDEPVHYGMDIYVHYGIGPDNSAYLCPYKMKGEPCPICEAKKQAYNEGDEETAKQLEPTYRVLSFMINRAKESEGPKLWAAPWTVDSNICAVSVDEDTNEVIYIDDPKTGYDAFFTRDGTGRNTKYSGEKIARKPSPLHADPDLLEKWLQFVVDHPIPECLVYHDYDYIAKAFAGGLTPSKKEKDEVETKETSKSGKKETKAIKPDPELKEEEKEVVDEKGTASAEEAPELTWESVHEMDRDTLVEILESEKVSEEEYNTMSDEEIADAICTMYEIEKPEEKTKGSLKDRLAKMRKK